MIDLNDALKEFHVLDSDDQQAFLRMAANVIPCYAAEGAAVGVVILLADERVTIYSLGLEAADCAHLAQAAAHTIVGVSDLPTGTTTH